MLSASRVPGWVGSPGEWAATGRAGSGHGRPIDKHRAALPTGLPTLPVALQFRARGKQPGLPGIRVPDPQAHPAALRLPAGGAPTDHPLWAQRHWENLPGQSALRVPGAPGGTRADRRGHCHLQRGPQVQQGEEVIRRLLTSQGSLSGPCRTFDATTS